MNSDGGYVLKNADGIYYCGLKTFSDKFYKAQIYHSISYAEEALEKINEEKYRGGDFQLVKVKLSEVDDFEITDPMIRMLKEIQDNCRINRRCSKCRFHMDEISTLNLDHCRLWRHPDIWDLWEVNKNDSKSE